MIVEEYNVFGDGVNITARLEQLADPGGIVLSEAVYQQVKGRSDLPIVEMGTRTLKNIDQPIKLYRIGPDALGGAPTRQTDRGSDARLKIRDAIVSAVDEIAREVKDVKQGEGLEGPEVDEQRITAVAAVFSPGTLALTAIGVLLVLARTSGWSDNAWYPFLGVWVLGIAAGRLVKGVRTGRPLPAHAVDRPRDRCSLLRQRRRAGDPVGDRGSHARQLDPGTTTFLGLHGGLETGDW